MGVSFRHFQFASFHSHGVSFSIIIRYVPQIDRTNLGEPRGSSIVLGEGCFGTCQKMDYRGIAVAVKQFKAHVKASAVRNEASILRQLDHPGEQLSSFASRETEWFVGGGREGSNSTSSDHLPGSCKCQLSLNILAYLCIPIFRLATPVWSLHFSESSFTSYSVPRRGWKVPDSDQCCQDGTCG